MSGAGICAEQPNRLMIRITQISRGKDKTFIEIFANQFLLSIIEKSLPFKELLVGKETVKNLWEIFRAFFLMVELEPEFIVQVCHITNIRMQVRLE